MQCRKILRVALVGRMADGWPRPDASTMPAVWYAFGDAVRGVTRLVLVGGLRGA
jgi:hypothetical protein